jgi:hypothetical protein
MRLGVVGFWKMTGEIATVAAAGGRDVTWALSRSANPAGAGITPERCAGADPAGPPPGGRGSQEGAVRAAAGVAGRTRVFRFGELPREVA